MACTFYDDCCRDYKAVCSSNEDEFHEVLTSRSIRKADLQCVTLDWESYWMVSRCDKDLGIVKERCENPVCNDTLTSVPVTDSAGISYRNVYCAVCQSVETTDLQAWDARLNCQDISTSQDVDIANMLCRDCTLSLAPPAAHAARKCHPHMESVQCNTDETGHGCEQYTALVDFEGQIYKNPHCLSCNRNVSEFKVKCGGGGIPRYMSHDPDAAVSEYVSQIQSLGFDFYYDYDHTSTALSPPYHGIDKGDNVGVPLSIVLDFGSSGRSSSMKILQNAEVITEKVVNCPKGKVFVERLFGSGDCVAVSCPDGLRLQDGNCIPDNSIKCDMNSGNNTVILKARLVEASEFCGDGLLRNGSVGILSRLLGDNSFAESHIINESVVCNDKDTVDVSYTVTSSIDVFEDVQELLDNIITSNSQQDIPIIANNINKLEITKSCLNPDLEYKCDSDWILDDEHIVVWTNTSYLVLLNKTSEWITADGIISRIRYESGNADSGLQKNLEVKICHIDNYLSCPFLTMNNSLFERLNSTGEIQYLPNGHILKPTEYVLTSDDQLLVCSFFNQSATMNITEIVTFFEYSNAQTIVSIIGGVFSLIAIILTFITYAVFASLRNRASRLIMNLVIALFLGQFLLMFGGNQTQNPTACFSIAVVAHYAWLAAFAWMNALAFDLDRTFGNPDNLQKVNEGRRSLVLYMTYAWGSPLVIVIPCIAIHFCQCTKIHFQYGSSSACWISDGTANLLTFGVPAAVFLLCNGVLFGHTVTGIRSAKKATARIHKDQSKLKRTTKELLIYIKVSILMELNLLTCNFCSRKQTLHKL